MLNKADLEYYVKVGFISAGQAKEITNFQNQIKSLDSTVKQLQATQTRQAQSEINTLAKMRIAETNYLTAKKAQSSEIKKLQAVYNGYRGQLVTVRKAQLASRDATLQAIAAQKQLELALSKSGSMMTLNAAKKLQGNITQGFAAMATAGENALTGIRRTIQRILTTMITLSAFFLFKRLIEGGMQFENQMVKLGSIIRATGKDMQQLTNFIRETGRTTIYSANQLADLAMILGQAGFTAKDILSSLLPILKLTTVTMGDLEETTRLVIGILRSFNLDVAKTSEVVDLLTETTIQSMADIKKLGIAFQYAGPAGASFGQSLETTLASVARFIDLGQEASTAGTTFRRALIELSNVTPKQEKVLRELNLSYESINPSLNDFGDILNRLSRTSITANQAITLFSDRAGGAVFSLIQRMRMGGETITEFTKKLSDAKDLHRTEEIYKKVMTTLSSQFELTRNNLQDMGLSLFNVFKPALTKIILDVRDAVAGFNDKLKSTTGKNFAETLANIVPLISQFIMGLQTVIIIVVLIISKMSLLAKAFEPFAMIIKVITILMGAYIIKSILVNKVTQEFVSIIANVVKRLLLWQGVMSATTKEMVVMGETTKVTTVAFSQMALATKILRTALMTVGIGIAIATLGYLISLFTDWIAETNDATDSLDTMSDSIETQNEHFQRLSDQTKLQIRNQQELNKLAKEGAIAYTGEGAALEGLALKQFNLNDILAKQQVAQAPKFEFGDLMSDIQLYTGAISKLMPMIYKSLEIDPKQLDSFDASMDTIRQHGVKAFESVANAIYEGNKNLSEREMRGIMDGFLTQLKNSSLSSDVKTVFDQVNEGVQGPDFYNMFGKMDKDVLSGLIKIASTMDINFKKMTKETQKIFLDGVIIPMILGMKDVGKATEEMQQKSAQMAQTLLEPAQRATANLRLVVTKIKQEFANFLMSSKDSSKTIFENRKAFNEEVIRFNSAMTAHNAEIRRDMAIEASLRAEGKIDAADAKAITIKQKEESGKLLSQWGDMLESGQKIKANYLLILAQIEENKAKNAVLIAQEKASNKAVEDKQALLKENTLLYNNFYKTTLASLGTVRDLSTEFSTIQWEAKFNESVVAQKELNRQLEIAQVFEMKYADARKNTKNVNAQALAQYKVLTKITQDGVEVSAYDLQLAQQTLDVANANTAATDEEKQMAELTVKILDIKLQLQEQINAQNQEQITLVDTLNKKWKEVALNTPVDKIQQLTEDYNNFVKDMETKEKVKINAALTVTTASIQTPAEQRSNGAEEIKRITKETNDILAIRLDLYNREIDKLKTIYEREQGLLGTRRAIAKTFGLDAIAKQYEDQFALEDEILRVETNLASMRKATNRDDSAIKLNEQYLNTLKVLEKYPGTLEVIKAANQATFSALSEAAAQAANVLVDHWLGIQNAEEEKKFADDMAKIAKDLADELAKIWDDYYEKLRQAADEHMKNLMEINSKFNKEIRDKEGEIYNERVQRMMSLAALEEEMRNKGLSSEEERAALLAQIDQNLATSRLGTIEERQTKLAAIEEQVKALNELENQLGMSRSEVEQSSIARLGELQTATSEFYNDKRTEAIATINAERDAEIAAENQRYADQIAALQRDRDRDLAAAQLKADLARRELADERAKAKESKNIVADMLKTIVSAAITAAVTKAVSWVFATVPFPISLLVAAGAAASVAAVMGTIASKYQHGGEVKRAMGGKITGGHGGIDDIHTALPAGSYVVNRQASRLHEAELMAMASGGSIMRKNMVPVALTAGEIAITPPNSIKYHNRLEEINSNRLFNGGMVRRGYAAGGSVSNAASGGGNTTIIQVPISFDGTNIITGNESDIAELYEKAILKRVQRSLDNNELVIKN